MLNRLIILAFLVFSQVGCKEKIVHNLSESDANKLVTRLYLAQVNPEKVRQADGTWAISVPKKNSLKAISLLEESRVFKKYNSNVESGKSLLSSRMEQKLTYENSLSSQLEYTLGSVKGVLESHVHLNLSSNTDFWNHEENKLKQDSASILLIVNNDFVLKEEDVKKIISGASGVTSEKVSVVINFSKIAIEDKQREESLAVIDEEFAIDKANSVEGLKGITDINYYNYLGLILGLCLLTYLVIKRRKVNNFNELFRLKT